MLKVIIQQCFLPCTVELFIFNKTQLTLHENKTMTRNSQEVSIMLPRNIPCTDPIDRMFHCFIHNYDKYTEVLNTTPACTNIPAYHLRPKVASTLCVFSCSQCRHSIQRHFPGPELCTQACLSVLSDFCTCVYEPCQPCQLSDHDLEQCQSHHVHFVLSVSLKSSFGPVFTGASVPL